MDENYSIIDAKAVYPENVDFTKMKIHGGLHPTDARGQYISPKPTSKRNKKLRHG